MTENYWKLLNTAYQLAPPHGGIPCVRLIPPKLVPVIKELDRICTNYKPPQVDIIMEAVHKLENPLHKFFPAAAHDWYYAYQLKWKTRFLLGRIARKWLN